MASGKRQGFFFNFILLFRPCDATNDNIQQMDCLNFVTPRYV